VVSEHVGVADIGLRHVHRLVPATHRAS
jgi:hypothetical protein